MASTRASRRTSRAHRIARWSTGAAPRERRGHILLLAGAALAVAALSGAAVVAVRSSATSTNATLSLPAASSSRGGGADPEMVDLVQQRAVMAALGQAGLSAEVLTAAGVTPPQATALAAAVAQDIETLGSDLSEANASVVSLEQQADALERLLVAGQISQEQANQLATARDALASARLNRDAAVAAVWEAAVEGLDPEVVARIEHLCNCAQPDLPVEFRAMTATAEQWAALANAYTSVRVDESLARDPDPAAEAIVDAAANNQAVTAAAGRMGALEQVRANLLAAAGQ
jgi:hypothetical protein